MRLHFHIAHGDAGGKPVAHINFSFTFQLPFKRFPLIIMSSSVLCLLDRFSPLLQSNMLYLTRVVQTSIVILSSHSELILLTVVFSHRTWKSICLQVKSSKLHCSILEKKCSFKNKRGK